MEPRVSLSQDRCQLSEILNVLIQKEFEFFKVRRKSGFPEKPGAFVRLSRIFRLNLQCRIRYLARAAIIPSGWHISARNLRDRYLFCKKQP
jgi:hypothetical protein